MEQDFNELDMIRAMGDKDFDVEAFLKSKDGEAMKKNFWFMQFAEDSNEILEFWRNYEKGLIKELHGDPEDRVSRWAFYLLTAATLPDNKRKFPLIFCMHGANNPIALTESYGVMQVAARVEAIVIAPENERLDHILILLDFAKEHYPVDESRVYSIGYSFGAFISAQNVLQRPDLFAGIGMGGMLFAGEVNENELSGVTYPEFHVTSEMIDHVASLEMPSCLFMGENEILYLEPIWKDPYIMPPGVIDLSGAAKEKAFNVWRNVGGCKDYIFINPEITCQNHPDPVVRSIGAEFERTEIRTYNDRRYFIGDSINPSGECLFRTISCEKMNHSATAAFAELVWEHISKYARDLNTGKLIRLNQ